MHDLGNFSELCGIGAVPNCLVAGAGVTGYADCGLYGRGLGEPNKRDDWGMSLQVGRLAYERCAPCQSCCLCLGMS